MCRDAYRVVSTGQDIVNTAITVLRGTHYDQCGSRCFPENWPHCVDCSGLVSACLRLNGLGEHGCEGSFAIMRRVYGANLELSIDQARHVPGAVLALGVNNGRGGIPGVDPGHIGISVGDGIHSLEARGHWAGVGMFTIDSIGRWDGAGMLPEVAYGTVIGQPAPPSIMPLPPVRSFQENTMHVAAAQAHTGVYLLEPNGGVEAYGVPFYGSIPGLVASKTIAAPLDLVFDWATSILLTPAQHGYWIGTAAGYVYSFGDATYYGGFHGLLGPLQTVVQLFPNPHDPSHYQAVQDDGTVLNPKAA